MKSIRSILASSLLAACGHETIDSSTFDYAECTNFHLDYLGTIDPAKPFDYAALRSVGDATGTGDPVAERGAACRTASDPTACQAALDAAPPQRGFMLSDCVDLCEEYVLRVNEGDSVRTLVTKEAVHEWLGTIDTETEAAFLIALEGYDVTCDQPVVKTTGSGFEVLAEAYTRDCEPIERTQFRFQVDPRGAITVRESKVVESSSACIGRRPGGLVEHVSEGATAIGAYFARCARLEAASVHAFAVIERELRYHGAPAALVQRARAARKDEIRHARLMRALARRHGGVYAAPRIDRQPLRSLEAMALDNATEGCVRETFGALVGQWQARTAQDPTVRQVLADIAEDETRHAELSWALDAWLLAQLDQPARARVLAAREAALIELEGAEGAVGELVRLAGMPDARANRRLTQRFVQLLRAA